MNSSNIVTCNDCISLKQLYGQIDCTLMDMIRNKYANISYNTRLYFEKDLFKDLVRYRRVVYNRIYNPTYPCSTIDIQDIFTQVKTRAYFKDCSLCPDCFAEGNTSTSTQTSSTTYTTTFDEGQP